jgi:hypothetical protein
LAAAAGNAMIEFAFAAGVLLPLFLGTFQFDYTFYVYNLLNTQVRAGAPCVVSTTPIACRISGRLARNAR